MTMAETPGRTCRTCGHAPLRPVWTISTPADRQGIFLACPQCETLSFYGPTLRPEPPAAAYPETYYGEGEAKFRGITGWLRRASAAGRARRACQRAGKPARCFDLGCGDGDFLVFLQSAGLEVFGSELPGPGLTRATARLPGRVSGDPDALAVLPDASLDLVTLWQVYEHLEKPLDWLDLIGRKLRPGGWLCLAIPNPSSWQARIFGADWLHLDPPRHLHLATPGALTRLLEGRGFAVAHQINPWIEFGPIGIVQSVFNRCGRPRDEFFDELRLGPRGKPSIRRWLYLLATAILLPGAVVWSAAEAWCGQPATFELWLRRQPERA
jgi:SAM-dependent methyltransferase